MTAGLGGGNPGAAMAPAPPAIGGRRSEADPRDAVPYAPATREVPGVMHGAPVTTGTETGSRPTRDRLMTGS